MKYFKQALEEAEEKDKELQDFVSQGGDPFELGLLFGIPISVKDQIHCRGTLSTMGLGSRSDKCTPTDAVSVTLMRQQGAIVIVKGNLTEGWLGTMTDNEIWGAAKHPLDHTRTAGGSTGGDAGLLAAGCIPLSLGTDFGGSIRIPANFWGLTGFAPSMERHSIKGLSCYTEVDGVNLKPNRPVIGPLGRWVDDLIEAMKALWSGTMDQHDTSIPNIPFNHDMFNETLNKRLRIGVCKLDIISYPGPAAERAFNKCQEVLGKHHELIEFEMPEVENFFKTGLRILLNEAMPAVYEEMLRAGDGLHPNTQTMGWMYNNMPRWLVKILGLIARIAGLPRVGELLSTFSPDDIDEFYKLMKERFRILQNIAKKYHELNLDWIITPGFPTAAYKIEDGPEATIVPGPFPLFNSLGYPSGVLPVTTVLEGEDNYTEPLFNDQQTAVLDRSARGSVGLPIGVQIAAITWQDEKALAAMKILETLLKE